MKTKLDVALETLTIIPETEAYHLKDKAALKAIAEIKAMPEENCGSCEHREMEIGPYGFRHYCNLTWNVVGIVCGVIEDKEFCGRWEAKK